MISLRIELNEYDDKIDALYVKFDYGDEQMKTEEARRDYYRANIIEQLIFLKNTNPVEHSTNTLDQTGARDGSKEYRKIELPKISVPTFCNGKDESLF